ncbi:MAG: hypothetical protein KDA98_14050 [Acidimicrobiales bacterium]|nr:hypothetical protein [Acidimicrobiales bacterium]
MGFFKDVNKLKKMGKEMQANDDPAARMRDATAQMKAMSDAMAGQAQLAADPADAVGGTVTVTGVGVSTGMVNMNPILQLDVLVQGDGLMPMPASQQVTVPMGHMARLAPGTAFPARISRSDPTTFTILWDG